MGLVWEEEITHQGLWEDQMRQRCMKQEHHFLTVACCAPRVSARLSAALLQRASPDRKGTAVQGSCPHGTSWSSAVHRHRQNRICVISEVPARGTQRGLHEAWAQKSAVLRKRKATPGRGNRSSEVSEAEKHQATQIQPGTVESCGRRPGALTWVRTRARDHLPGSSENTVFQ